MHRPPSFAALAVAVLAVVVPPLAAQPELPKPAAELKQLAPLLGNWTGKGRMTEPSGVVTEWTATATYRTALGGHFVQQDAAVRFHGIDHPIVMRAWFGWDSERRRFVNAAVNSGGELGLHEVKLLPDGSIVQLALQQHPSVAFAQRSVFRVEGDTMVHTVDLLMPTGPSLSLVDGKFTRGGDGFAGDANAKAWMGAKPHDALARLARSAGEYEVAGAMTMVPGAPEMKVAGTDVFRPMYGGMVFAGTSTGRVEGLPGEYAAEMMWAHDPGRDCVLGVYVDNMGAVMAMDSHWAPGGQLVTIGAHLFQGQPAVQRMVMTFDDAGAPKTVSSHSTFGTAAPFESWRATYTRK